MEKKDQKLDKLNIDSTEYSTKVTSKFKNRELYKIPDKGLLKSFIPGTIVEVLVKEGDNVCKGDDLLVLEAMKMKNRLKSPVDGKVKGINVSEGEKVAKGVLLIEIK